MRATKHFVFKEWEAQRDKNDKDGKLCFVPPDDENQRFDKLLDVCTYELREAQDVEPLVFDKTSFDGNLRCDMCNIAGINYEIIRLHQISCSDACKECFYALQNQFCQNTIIDDQSSSWSLIKYDTTKSKSDQEHDSKLLQKDSS